MENNILELEKKYWQGMADHDYEVVRQLTKFPCIVAGKRGVMTVDEPAYQKMFEQGSNRQVKVKQISEAQVQEGADHAMIAYLIELEYDGQHMHCACTSTWVKENGAWRCAMHTESDLEPKQEQ